MASRVPTFKEFWQAYPRKRGKDKAEKVWKGMRPEARQLAFAALPAYIDDYQRNNVTFMYPQASCVSVPTINKTYDVTIHITPITG